MTTTGTNTRRRWPLVLLALPASVAIWSGWVELGQMAGFGLVRPLPGIADEFTLNSAITLPIGVEAYSAYALGTWLSGRPIPASARRFAAWSSLAALALGLLGQVVYHVLSTTGHDRAPVAVVVFVACLPVLVLGAGAALHHLLGDDLPATAPTAAAPATGTVVSTRSPDASVSAGPDASAPALKPARKPGRKRGRRRLLAEYLTDARAQLEPGAEPTPAWCRRVTGCSAGTSVKLAAALRAELDSPPAPPALTAAPAGLDQKEHAA